MKMPTVYLDALLSWYNTRVFPVLSSFASASANSLSNAPLQQDCDDIDDLLRSMTTNLAANGLSLSATSILQDPSSINPALQGASSSSTPVVGHRLADLPQAFPPPKHVPTSIQPEEEEVVPTKIPAAKKKAPKGAQGNTGPRKTRSSAPRPPA